MKLLLPKNKSNIDGSADICLLDNGQLISNPSAVLNDFFGSPRIQESVLNLPEESFSDYPSIAAIKNKSCLLDLAYGVQEPALQLLRSYLHDRKQMVICNNKFSSWSGKYP